jgi:hypothetical protein
LKGFSAVVAKQAAKELAQSIQADEDGFIDINVVIVEEEEGGKPREFLNNSTTIVINVATGTKRERTRL